MADLKRKSIESIALAAEVPVRTLQEFLSQFVWDDGRVDDHLQRRAGARKNSLFAGVFWCRAVAELDSRLRGNDALGECVVGECCTGFPPARE